MKNKRGRVTILSIFLNWLYVTITIFPIGYSITKVFYKFFKCNLTSTNEILMSGLVGVTIYAQLFSLFYSLSFLTNVILCLLSTICFFSYRKDIYAFLHECCSHLSCYRLLIFFTFTIIISYFTSRGYEHFDTGLYHAQAIHWIEEFGIVPGLGNLNYRIGYNSSAFVITALYSMKFLLQQSLHTLSGYFLCLLCSIIIFDYKPMKNFSIRISDFCRFAGLYYISTTFASLNSPASDYFASAIIIYIAIKYIDKIEAKEENISTFAWISLLACFALTLKLSATPMILIVLKPMVILLKNKDWKKIILFISMGIIIILPFLIRGIMISGWLLYPNTTIDLFTFDFKVHEEIAYFDQLVIMLWGRNAEIGDTFFTWFPKWFSELDNFFDIALILSCAISLCLICLLWLYEFYNKKINLNLITLDLTIICGFLFWFFSAPLMRYGYAFTVLTVCLISGRFLQYFSYHHLHKLILLSIIFIAIYKIKTTYDLGIAWISFDSYIFQQDYYTMDMQEVEYEGITFFIPINSDQPGYHYFPAGSANPNYTLRGTTLKEGFRPK